MDTQILQMATSLGHDKATLDELKAKPMDEERRKFLEDAIKSVSYDVPEKLRDCCLVLKDATAGVDARCEALEDLQFECERADAANDLEKVDGLSALLAQTTHQDSEVRMLAYWTLGVCCQQNEPFQARMLELGWMNKLIERLGEEEEEKVRVKQIMNLSGLVRNNPKCLHAFLTAEGFPSLGGSCGSSSPKIRMKAVFLVSALLGEGDRENATKMAIAAGVFPLMARALATELAGDIVADSVEQVLMGLLHLMPPTPGALGSLNLAGLPTQLRELSARVAEGEEFGKVREQLAALADISK